MHRRDLLAAAAGLATWSGVAVTTASASSTAPPTLSQVATLDISRARDFVTDRDKGLAYVAVSDGFVVVDVSEPADPGTVVEVRSILSDHEKGPLDSIRDVKVHGDHLLVSGQGWANVDSGTAVALYDVSDPSAPERLAVHETAFPVHNAAFDDTAAYLTATNTERWPVVVLDVEEELREVARWSVLDVDEQWAEVKPPVRRVHDVHLDGDLLYVANWDAGMRVLDVSDPSNPTQVAVLGGRTPQEILDTDTYQPRGPLGPEVLELPGNATTSRTNSDESLLAVSKEATDMKSQTARRGGPGPIDIWDVSNLDDPTKVITLAPPALDETGARNSKNCEWRGDRFYAAWREDGVRVYDLSTASSPLILGSNTEFDAHTARALADGFAALQHTGRNGGRDKPGRLFVFRDPESDDATPAATGSPLDDPQPTQTTSRTTTETPTSRTSTQSRTTQQGTTSTGTTATTSEATDVGTPGFTAVAGVVGGSLAVALRAWRRRRD